MFKFIREEVENILEKDPAARDLFTATFFYPGLMALVYHKLSHRLYKKKKNLG